MKACSLPGPHNVHSSGQCTNIPISNPHLILFCLGQNDAIKLEVVLFVLCCSEFGQQQDALGCCGFGQQQEAFDYQNSLADVQGKDTSSTGLQAVVQRKYTSSTWLWAVNQQLRR